MNSTLAGINCGIACTNCNSTCMNCWQIRTAVITFGTLISQLVRIFIVNMLLLFVCIAAFSQQSRQYSFKQFTSGNGLSSNSVKRIEQDKDGYIWLATTNGLQRYDGNSFLTFKSRTNDPTSIPDDHVLLNYIDKKGNLWLILNNGQIGTFDTKKFIYKDVPIENQDGPLYISEHFQELPSGEMILVKGDGNFLKYLPKENKFIQSADVLPKVKNWRRIWIQWDEPIKRYWICCDSGLVQFDPATKHLNYRGHNIDNDPVIKAFEDIRRPFRTFIDRKGNISFICWMPNAPGPVMFRYNRKLQKSQMFYTSHRGYHEIGYFLEQRNGKVWIYGKPFLSEWVDVNEQPTFLEVPNEYRNEHSLKFDYINHMIEDRENNLWLATDNGIYLFNPDSQIFNTHYIIKDGKPMEAPVQAMEETKDGRIFVGCWGAGGVTCYDQNFNSLPMPSEFPKGGDISTWDMARHPKTGEIWMTMQAGSIVIFNSVTNKFRRVTPEVFGGSTIRQVDEDTSGNMWFGTQNGKVIKWDLKKSGGDASKGYELILQTGLAHKVHYDYSGYIYVATLGHGLVKIDAKTNRVVRVFSTKGPEGERLYMDSPGDMTYYDDSTLIISAGCINVLNTKTNKIYFITKENGLPSHTTESVEKDASGILWVGLTNGLCRLNLAKKLITYYDRRDGMVNDKFSMASVKELSDGRLAFFTDHDFMVFDPKKFGQLSVPPRPFITGFKLGGSALSLDSIMQEKKAVLKYNNSSITINFSALSYLQQRKIYYYKLEHLDKEWIRTDEPTEVVYNYLPPGEYTFRVKTENADGMTNEYIASLPITVRPPVWKTWWFYSLIALLIIAVLYLLDRERMNKLRSLQQLRRQVRLNLANDINTTLNNISVLSEIAKIKADKNVMQAKDYIDQIRDKSGYMMEVMDDTLWSLDPQNDSMKQTLLRLREVTEALRIAHGVEIDLIVDNKVQSLDLDMKLRHEIFFYYKEAMSYVIQNLCCKQVFVNINKVKSKLMIEILSECECDRITGFEEKFANAVHRRVSALPATLDVLADTNSFSALLYVNVSK